VGHGWALIRHTLRLSVLHAECTLPSRIERVKIVTGQFKVAHLHFCRVGQNRISAPYMTVYMVISLPKIPYVHCIYL